MNNAKIKDFLISAQCVFRMTYQFKTSSVVDTEDDGDAD